MTRTRRKHLRVTAPLEDDPRDFVPRFRWTRLSLSVCILLALTLLTWRWQWLRSADRELATLRAEVEQLVARVPRVSNDEDAYPLLKAAIEACRTSEWNPESPELSHYRKDAEARARLAKYVAAQRAVLQTVRDARERRSASWPEDSTGIYETAILRGLLAQAILDAHLRVDDAAAIEHVRDLLAVANHVRGSGGITAEYWGMNLRAVAVSLVLDLTPALQVGPPPHAGPDQVRALIDELLHEGASPSRTKRALELDAASDARIAMMRSPRKWHQQDNPAMLLDALEWLAKPYDTERAAINVRRTLEFADAMGEPSATLASSRASKLYATAQRSRFVRADRPQPAQWLVESRDGHSYITPSAPYDWMNEQRRAALALAAALYRAKRGEWPADHTQLVPRYIPEVPLDPRQAQSVPVDLLIPDAGGTLTPASRQANNE